METIVKYSDEVHDKSVVVNRLLKAIWDYCNIYEPVSDKKCEQILKLLGIVMDLSDTITELSDEIHDISKHMLQDVDQDELLPQENAV